MAADLDAYFERIGWAGPNTPTREVLEEILALHMRAIPFENLDVLLGRRIRLDLDGLFAKLVHGKRGGYCYEHSTLVANVLERLGFSVRMHSARVVMVSPRAVSPRTHMFLTVGEDVMIDPGFGGLAPRFPVPLDGTPVRDYCLVRDGAELALEMKLGGKQQRLWVSTLEHDLPIDFEMANHFTSTFPASPFVNRMMLRVFTAEGRVSVMNRDVSILRGTETQTTQLADRGALREILTTYFGFDLPAVLELRVPSIPEWT